MGGKHVLVDDGPRVKKDNFDVEQDKEHGDEVEFHGHAAGTLALGQHAALVGGILDRFLGGGAAAKTKADEPGNKQIAGRKGDSDEAEYQNRKILLQLSHGTKVACRPTENQVERRICGLPRGGEVRINSRSMAEHDAESDWLFEFWAWLETHRLQAIVIAGLLLLGGFGWYTSNYYSDQHLKESEEELAGVGQLRDLSEAYKQMQEARDQTTSEDAQKRIDAQMAALRKRIEGLGVTGKSSGGTNAPALFAAGNYEDIYLKYKGTPAGIRARFLWAKALFNSGELENAATAFAGFIEDHGDHALTPLAHLGAAACLDEQGKPGDAEKAYDLVIEKYPDQQAAMIARLNKGALLSGQADREADAKKEFEAVLEQDRDFFMRFLDFRGTGQFNSMTARTAQQLRVQLLEKHPELDPQPAVPEIIPPDDNTTESENNSTQPATSNSTKPDGNNTKPAGNETKQESNASKKN